MARALLVVSSFNPAMLADMQRARMLAWELPGFGWTVEVLTPKASEVRQDAIEPDPAAFFPESLVVHEVGSLWRPAFELLGSRTHAWRTLGPMYRRGCQLLQSRHYDLIYITTATSTYFALGAWWKRKFNVPYVLDFHDPWIRDPAASDSIFKFRRRLLDQLSRSLERKSVTQASGLVAVSPRYIEQLRLRYENLKPPWLVPDRNAVIPFCAQQRDLQEAEQSIDPAAVAPSRFITLAYVGVGGAIMVRAFDLICGALAVMRRNKHPLVERLRLKLFGTIYGWHEGIPKDLEYVAVRHGVADLVEEAPQRIAYRRSLEVLIQAQGAIVLGVDDPGYMPSKLFSYALSGKPLLASLRRESPAFEKFAGIPSLGHALWFDDTGQMPMADAVHVVSAFLEEAAAHRRFDRGTALEPYLATEMARRHAQLFDACISGRKRPG